MADRMRVQILKDGTFKTTTDEISAANHSSAEAFLKGIEDLAGGESTRERQGEAHDHEHTHEEQHEHEGQ